MGWPTSLLLGLMQFVIRPKLSADEAEKIMRDGALAKGWTIGLLEVDRHLKWYHGIGFIRDAEDSVVLFSVDGRSGELLSIDRHDHDVHGDVPDSAA